VIFRRDLKDIGDVRALQGKEVDIEGKIRLYEGHPEVIVHDSRQLKGQGANLAPIPKNYEVTNRGKFSPGQRPMNKNKTPKWKHPRHGAEGVPED
jgi:hypothetical protein